jgi:methylenetetrahydrofolate reductase (NADPH)
MKIKDLLSAAAKPVFSLEVLPVKNESAAANLGRYRDLLQLNPLFVDFPFHPGRSGNFPDLGRYLPTSKELSRVLMDTFDLTPLVHLLCRGFTREQTEMQLQELLQLGVENLLLLRGDVSGTAEFPGHKFAYQLVEQVRKFNQSPLFPAEKLPFFPGFGVGVAGYPEFPAEDSETALMLQHLKQKVDAGADFILTQLFFDNEHFFAFKKACRQAGITVPIIPGICPVTAAGMLKKLPVFFRVSVPEDLQQELDNCRDEKMLAEAGITWAENQAKELLRKGVKCIHFFALAKPVYIQQVVQAVF